MDRKLRACAAALIALGTAGMASADNELSAAIDKDYEENLGPLFQYFHQHPELSFLETETAKRLASELRALGYDVTEGVGGTGVVAVLKNGDGPTVLMRADMDGLPLKEDSGRRPTLHGHTSRHRRHREACDACLRA
jgi:metal-dependent amidase/aminoacylase/carboxypeptidase family protein